MKKLLILPVLAFSLFACNVAGDKEYEELAKDTCGCVNSSTKDLSDEMVGVIVNSGGDPAKLEDEMAAYAQANPIQAMQDVQIMQGSMMTDLTACMEALEKKYDNVYSAESEKEVQDNLMEKLKEMDDCKSSVAFLKIGLSQQ